MLTGVNSRRSGGRGNCLSSGNCFRSARLLPLATPNPRTTTSTRPLATLPNGGRWRPDRVRDREADSTTDLRDDTHHPMPGALEGALFVLFRFVGIGYAIAAESARNNRLRPCRYRTEVS